MAAARPDDVRVDDAEATEPGLGPAGFGRPLGMSHTLEENEQDDESRRFGEPFRLHGISRDSS